MKRLQETIERLERLKSWLRLVFLTEEDLHVVVNDLYEDGAAVALDYESGSV